MITNVDRAKFEKIIAGCKPDEQIMITRVKRCTNCYEGTVLYNSYGYRCMSCDGVGWVTKARTVMGTDYHDFNLESKPEPKWPDQAEDISGISIDYGDFVEFKPAETITPFAGPDDSIARACVTSKNKGWHHQQPIWELTLGFGSGVVSVPANCCRVLRKAADK